MSELEQVQQDYAESLQELTFNSRPLITLLTQIAQENVQAAEGIAKTIEMHIAKYNSNKTKSKETNKCPQPHKLFALYLLDSISKNVGAPYTSYFGRNLYKTFTETYTLVTEVTRQKLCDLFRTWKQPSPVTGQSLFAPDQISKIDGFLAAVRKHAPMFPSQAASSSVVMTPSGSPRLSQSGLLLQVDRLLHMTLQRQTRNPRDSDANEQAQILNRLKNALSTSALPLDMLPKIEAQLNTFAQKEQRRAQQQSQQAAMSRLNTSQYGQYSSPQPEKDLFGRDPRLQQQQQQQQVSPPSQPQPPKLSTPDVSDLLSKLQTSALFNSVNSNPPPASAPAPLPSGLASVLSSLGATLAGNIGVSGNSQETVQLTNADLIKPRPELISRLYQDMPNQCANCGKRYRSTQAKMKENHVDWHFRVSDSLRDKEDIRGGVTQHRVQNRCWYLSCEAWIEFKDQEGILGLFGDGNGAQEDGNNNTNQKGNNGLIKKNEDPNKHKVAVPKNATLSKLPCPVCQEKFETGWDDASESWMWINAIKDKNRIYHYTCYQEVASTNAGGPGGGGVSLLDKMRAQDRAKTIAYESARPQKRKADDNLENDPKRSMATSA